MPFDIIRNDITKVPADAIVNTANPLPKIGDGTDRAIYKAAGRLRLLKDRKKIGAIAPGESAWTYAYDLPAKYILHTVGPIWQGGHAGEEKVLKSAYESALTLADQLDCESVAFPLLSTGSYGYPRDQAMHVALSAIGAFLLNHEMQVTLVVLDEESSVISRQLFSTLQEYLSEHEVGPILEEEYPHQNEPADRRRFFVGGIRGRKEGKQKGGSVFAGKAELPVLGPREERDSGILLSPSYTYPDLCTDFSRKSLEEVLAQKELSFQEKLLQLIDERGLTDVAVYKKANLDRRLFSHIRSNRDYQPKKKTAISLALALELDMAAMTDLLGRAEIALTPSSRFDLIVMYFVSRGDYDLDKINAALFEYHQPVLGG